MQTEVLIYDGIEELDAIGPYDVLGGVPGFEVRLVAEGEVREVRTAHGATLLPASALSAAPELLVVPGGGYAARAPQGSWAEARRGVLPAAIGARYRAGSIVAGVCTGVMLMAAAGLLRGLPAVTHRVALDDLAASGARVIAHARVVDGGRLLTSGGVTAGIDLALWLAERFQGPEAARARAVTLEYERTGVVWQAPGERSGHW